MLLPAAPSTNISFWQAVNSTATQVPSPGTATGPVIVTLLYNTSVQAGMPGSTAASPPPPSSAAKASLPYNGAWYDFYQAGGPAGAVTKQPSATGQQAKLPLARDLVVKGGAVNASTTMLDLAALQSLYSISPPQNNNSGNSSSLTFSNLTLLNLPPGPPSTYPLGLSTLMMWSIDMDR